MKKIMISTVLAMFLVPQSFAASKMTPKPFYVNYNLPVIAEAKFDDANFLTIKKEWNKLNRKVASSTTFSDEDMSADMRTLRDEWLKVKTGNEMEALLTQSYAKYDSYSPDTKYFLAQMHMALPLRGVVWRLRKLFENEKGFLGNKSTHVMAIQAVRTLVSGLKEFLPTSQTDAGIEFFTEPSLAMTNAGQLQSMNDLQNFLVVTIIPAINVATRRILNIQKDNPGGNYVWDNKIVFGTGTFEDEVQRYIGNGPAEVNFVISTLYRSYHDILVYCAYNQDHTIKVFADLGSHVGVDSGIFSSKKADLGITDKERIAVLKSAVKDHHFLELRNSATSKFGTDALKYAYIALKNSVVYAERAYDYLQTKDATQSMALNPILFQPEVGKNLDKGIKNMKAVVLGVTEVRDPVSGKTVTLNLPAFYEQPPTSLGILMATQFEEGEREKVIVNKSGEKLRVRNYLHGRASGWNNDVWKTYVPSAAGKPANYMTEVNRIISYSYGTSLVFGLPNRFVQ
jgi:uncharacterized protein YdcH (DUF465 family)